MGEIDKETVGAEQNGSHAVSTHDLHDTLSFLHWNEVGTLLIRSLSSKESIETLARST